MRAAILQIPSVGMSTSKFDYYLRIAKSKGCKVVLLGEYLLDRFFKELENTPVEMIKEQSDHHIKTLKALAKEYGVTIIAPLVIIKKKQPYKTIVKFSPTSTSYYHQQILINYKHWNEEKFFANEKAPLKAPLIFSVDGFKFAVMAGFELHFDTFWQEIMSKNVDAVLLPTVSTFESHQRWRELIKMRAFTNSCYIIRANRIGEYIEGDYNWNFYGDSLVVSPDGEIENHLGNQEELLMIDLDKKEVKDARKSWGFKEALQKR
ncbi:MAG TPA: carbon-nitrogen hydrolase family protein [Sulfurimonas sp.]|nr:carbon-nitrogen hydrolase family protein [Sulfurimonas sp.]